MSMLKFINYQVISTNKDIVLPYL